MREKKAFFHKNQVENKVHINLFYRFTTERCNFVLVVSTFVVGDLKLNELGCYYSITSVPSMRF